MNRACNRCIKDMHDERYANYISYGTFLYEFTWNNEPYQRFSNGIAPCISRNAKFRRIPPGKPWKIELNAIYAGIAINVKYLVIW